MILIASQLFFCFFFIPSLSSGADTLAVNQYLFGDQTLVSSAGNFELGFFRPGESPNYYIGIWYKKLKTTTVVWVANREIPISDRFSSKLNIIDGNLVLLNESNTQIWSTNMISTANSSASVVLLDDGNLVLIYGSSSSSPPIWQSFDHPTHTFLPGSKLAYDWQTNTKQVITSWRSTEDPNEGLYSLEIDPNQKSYVLKWNRSVQYWTSGSWNGQIFSLIPEMRLNYIFNFSYNSNENETYFSYSVYNRSTISRLLLDISGQLQHQVWLEREEQWALFWARPRSQCEIYALCGAFGTCSQNDIPFCSCLNGFKPRSESDWNRSNFSDGCMRITDLQCGRDVEKSFFRMIKVTSLPPHNNHVAVGSAIECLTTCSKNCSCNAYSFVDNQCSVWYGDLLNLSEDNTNAKTIYVKVASKDLTRNNGVTVGTVAGIVSGFFGLVFLFSIGIICYRRVKRQGSREENRENLELQFHNGATNVRYLVDPGILSAEDRKDIVVPFYEFKSILSATQNFSLANKLGQGGFGPVYKGMLPGGVEIAVKRLSSQSGQGLKEFKNEVLLIAKLQYRNLVRLLGYSMKDHEMILLYEYMPNKSLDRFIFDRTRCMCLDWAIRFDIIMGIARGLLYLHQDSRLRIIHRDLKPSNVLLDEEMNPKISDFGLAKIVKGRETEANTSRVIGTYGYMSPEYALDGLFSVKSDVFSFGVVVLEIISGKRNTGYYRNQQAFSLISYAWGLWKDKTPLDLLDPALAESCNSIEVLRCMIVGLLCIQEDPQDRPTMVNVVLMLGMDVESLPDPKEPAFVSKTHDHSLPSSSSKSDINQLTITEEEGR